MAFSQLDSLKRQLEQAQDWKEEINAHQDLAYYYTRGDSSQVMQHIDAMIDISKKQDDKLGLYQSYTSLASFYTHTSEYDLAENAMNIVYKISLQINEPEKTSAVLGNIGVLKYYQNEIDSAKYYLDTAYQIKKSLPDIDPSNLSRNLTSLAQISRELNQFKEAIHYQTEALKISKLLQDKSTYLNALSGMAGLYRDFEEPKKAFEYEQMVYKKALEINDAEVAGGSARNIGRNFLDRKNLDSAFYFFHEALDNFEKIGYKRGLTEVNISLGDWYVKNEELDRSIPFFYEAITNANEIGDERLAAAAKINLGLVFLDKKDYPKSIHLLNEALRLNESLDIAIGIQESYLALHSYYEKTNNWKEAHYFTTQHKIISDSLNREKLNKEVKTLQIKYETDLKDSKIEKQDLVIQNQETRQSLIIVLALAIMFLFFVTALSIWNRNKKNKLISEQNLEIKSAKIAELQKEKKIMAMSSMIEGQEAERARIAQDLHDGLGGLLSSVKLRLSNIDEQVKQIESYNVYERTSEIVDEACDEVRRISHNLLPGALRLEGLKSAVEHLSQELSEVHGIDVKTEIFGFEEMKDDTNSIFIFRIIQEATNNIVKYAKASNVLIQLFESDAQLQMVIEDDGVGFDTSKETKGLGLRSIASRVEFLKGDLEINSVINEGTTISISIPKVHS